MAKKNETAKTTPIAHRLQKLHLPQEKLASESHAETSSFFQFFTRSMYGEVALQSSKARFEHKTFYFAPKVALGYFGTTWSILHRASTKNYTAEQG